MVIKPAKKLSLLLQTRVILERADTEERARFNGHDILQWHLTENRNGMFLLEYGPQADLYDFSLTADQAFEKLADVVKELTKVRFWLPPLPVTSYIEDCSANIYRDVVVRMIEFYEIRTDEILTRYDVLVQKLA